MADLNRLRDLIEMEMVQRSEEGCDTSGFAERLSEAAGDHERLMALYGMLANLEP